MRFRAWLSLDDANGVYVSDSTDESLGHLVPWDSFVDDSLEDRVDLETNKQWARKLRQLASRLEDDGK